MVGRDSNGMLEEFYLLCIFRDEINQLKKKIQNKNLPCHLFVLFPKRIVAR